MKNKKEKYVDVVDELIKSNILFRLGGKIRAAEDATNRLSTGIAGLDYILDGGLKKGIIIENYAQESVGKTTLALNIIAANGTDRTIYIDAEHALDPKYCKDIGIDIEKLQIAQPDDAESALQLAEQLAKSGAKLIIIDSVAALVPRAELEGEIGKANVGMLARVLGQGLRKLTSIVARSGTVIIFINQIRDKIGGWGIPYTTPGGKALKFFSHLRLEMKKIKTIDISEKPYANKVKIQVVKTKCTSNPFAKCNAYLTFGRGFDIGCELFEEGQEYKLIKKAKVDGKSVFKFGEHILGNSRRKKQCIDKIRENNDIISALKESVIKEWSK